MVLEICAGSDVVDAVSTFAKWRNMGICVLGARLRHRVQPDPTGVDHDDENVAKNGNGGVGLGWSRLSISVAGGQGQVIGGVVAGKLTAASAVVVVAAAVVDPSFHRLGGGEEGVSRGKIVNSESCRGNNDSASSNDGGGVLKCEVGGT
ncbi:hypothetical protein Syun_001864 [Stephania yunnanensis]|uniref:PPC domain-containing protein n=1 Tax=Stephania yunnanensis TaxID=152371 RepID=A0AAP0LIQ2_9MAGN